MRTLKEIKENDLTIIVHKRQKGEFFKFMRTVGFKKLKTDNNKFFDITMYFKISTGELISYYFYEVVEPFVFLNEIVEFHEFANFKKVICKKDGLFEVTKGRTYTIIKELKLHFRIINDDNCELDYPKEFFELIEL